MRQGTDASWARSSRSRTSRISGPVRSGALLGSKAREHLPSEMVEHSSIVEVGRVKAAMKLTFLGEDAALEPSIQLGQLGRVTVLGVVLGEPRLRPHRYRPSPVSSGPSPSVRQNMGNVMRRWLPTSTCCAGRSRRPPLADAQTAVALEAAEGLLDLPASRLDPESFQPKVGHGGRMLDLAGTGPRPGGRLRDYVVDDRPWKRHHPAGGGLPACGGPRRRRRRDGGVTIPSPSRRGQRRPPSPASSPSWRVTARACAPPQRETTTRRRSSGVVTVS